LVNHVDTDIGSTDTEEDYNDKPSRGWVRKVIVILLLLISGCFLRGGLDTLFEGWIDDQVGYINSQDFRVAERVCGGNTASVRKLNDEVGDILHISCKDGDFTYRERVK
jgi:hypothetical protein